MNRHRLPLTLCLSLVALFALKVPGAGFWGPILMLGGLVFLHEGGHFLAAKYMGMPVEVFSLGFGPRLFGFKWRETDVRLSALPLGGYVKLAGFNPEDPGADDPYGFLQQPFGKRMLFYSGGILANLATSLILFTAVRADQARIIKAEPRPGSAMVVDQVAKGMPADVAGLQPGDELRRVGHILFPSGRWEDAVAYIKTHPAQPIAVEVLREGKLLSFSVTPTNENGVGRVGVGSLPMSYDFQRRPLQMGDLLTGGRIAIEDSWHMSGQVFGFLKKLVTFQARSAEVSGPIGIIKAGSRAAKSGWQEFLIMCGAISLQLGILNALPIPALDGGHMALLVFEKLRRKDLTIELKEKILTGGFLLLASLMALVIVMDVLKLRK
ncbi:RIP metalloprotease [Geothrix sp. PMB-07]|uniref:M50 family metallopeptidase n=1 Tax=Geothrix sp. PMB-07 TaxID=3068640 RepID=UPI0027429C2C|nr:site-2 protease family protein [Geothrix sp. PMB-07]WLT31671.1 site-2 protease family protein [Geothrix sp. PMB-07]